MMQTVFFSELTDLTHVHRCCGAGHYNPCCTDVIVQGHYFFSALGWIVITHPTGVAGCTSQCLC